MASSNPTSYLFGFVDLYNGDDMKKFNDGTLGIEQVRVLENIRVELGTGSKYIVLTPEHEQALMPRFQHYADITPVTGIIPVKTPVVGPLYLVLNKTAVEVSRYSCPHAKRTMIGLEAAAKLQLQINWDKYTFYIPLPRLGQETMTEHEDTKPTTDWFLRWFLWYLYFYFVSVCVCASALFIHSHHYWKLDSKSRASITIVFTIH